jgi:hypothetical protein
LLDWNKVGKNDPIDKARNKNRDDEKQIGDAFKFHRAFRLPVGDMQV